MHYYQFNIGDYAKSTRHLSNIEDLAYRRLIDLYYDKEEPLIKDIAKLSRLIGMKENQEEIAAVIDDFFSETEEGYKHHRIEDDIAIYHSKLAVARENGKKGGRPKKPRDNPEITQSKPKKTQSVILANPDKSDLQANQEPITKNHKPLTKNQEPINKRSMSSKLDLVHDIFEHWCKVMDKPVNATKLTPKRQQKIQDRLAQGYTPEDIKRAIDVCRDDPFSMGQNDRGKKYNDIELICRSGEKLEFFMETADATIQTKLSTAQKMAAEFERKYGAPPADLDFS